MILEVGFETVGERTLVIKVKKYGGVLLLLATTHVRYDVLKPGTRRQKFGEPVGGRGSGVDGAVVDLAFWPNHEYGGSFWGTRFVRQTLEVQTSVRTIASELGENRPGLLIPLRCWCAAR